MTDHELVELTIRGDNDAFDALVIRYQKEVFYTVRAMGMGIEDAKDITQQSFVKAYKNLKRLKNRDKFKSWLMSIAMNLARDEKRRSIRMVPFTTEVKTLQEDPVERNQKRDFVQKAIEKLPPKQKEVVVLRVFSGLSFSQIADLVGTKPETARANYHFAIKKLRDLFREKEYEL